MNTPRRITRNFVSLSVAEVISKGLQLLIFILLARYLGKNDFGLFSFGMAFALLITMISDFGLSTLLIREISRNKKLASKYITHASISKIVLSLFAILATYLFLEILNYSQEAKIITYILLTFAILQTYTDLYYSIFRSFEKMHYDAIIKIVRMLLLSGMMFYSIKNNLGIVLASFAFPLTEIIILTLTVSLVYKKFIKISFEFDSSFTRRMLKSSSMFCLSIAFTGMFMFTDSIMLSKLKSSVDVGIYSAASNLMLAAIFLPVMYGNAIYPVISKFYLSSKKSLKLAYERSFKYIVILGIFVSVMIYSLSDKIISILYGAEYSSSAIVLSILCWYLFLRFINVISGFTLSSINRQGSRALSQGIVALLNIILNFILIPKYGIFGAAFATVITELVFFSVYTSFIVKYGIKIKFATFFIRPIIGAALIIIILPYIDNIFLATFSGTVVYFSVLYFLKTLDKEDKLLFKKIVENK